MPNVESPDPKVAAAALAELRTLLREGLGARPTRILLFGSWARGDATRQSDIDIALLSAEAMPPGLLVALRDRIEESHIPYQVDLVDLSVAEGGFRRRVLEEAISWSD